MMLLDYFRGFGWIYGKMDKISKSRQFRGPTPWRRDPMQQRKSKLRRGVSTSRRGREGGLDKPRVRQGVAKLCCGKGLRHNVALFTDMCVRTNFVRLISGASVAQCEPAKRVI